MGSFTKKWPNRIISDTGFEVRIEDRGTIVYLENKKKIVANSEFLIDDEGILLFRSSLQFWTTPEKKESIPEKKSHEIEDNIRMALEFDNRKLKVV